MTKDFSVRGTQQLSGISCIILFDYHAYLGLPAECTSSWNGIKWTRLKVLKLVWVRYAPNLVMVKQSVYYTTYMHHPA